jgi:hypothetical protein
MTQPLYRSSINSGYAGSAWWKQQINGQLAYCASQGYTLVLKAQRFIQSSLGLFWAGPGETLPRPHGVGFAVDGVIGPRTVSGLYRIAADNGAPQSVLDQLTYDAVTARGQALQWGTCAALIYAAEGAPNHQSWRDVISPPDLISAAFDVAPPADGRSGLSGTEICWNINDPLPSALVSAMTTSDSAGLATPPPQGDQSVPGAPGSPGTAGSGNVDALDQPASGGTSISTTLAVDTGAAPSSTPWVVVGVGAAVVVTALIVRGVSGRRGATGRAGRRSRISRRRRART